MDNHLKEKTEEKPIQLPSQYSGALGGIGHMCPLDGTTELRSTSHG